MDIIINNTTYKVPNILQNNDAIILNGKTYSLLSKTYSIDTETLTGHIEEIYNQNNKIEVIELLVELYNTHEFITSGANTNEIQNHPKLMILATILGIILDGSCKQYINNVIINWNRKRIKWEDIITDSPIIKISNKEIIKTLTEEIIKEQKINTNLLPWNIN